MIPCAASAPYRCNFATLLSSTPVPWNFNAWLYRLKFALTFMSQLSFQHMPLKWQPWDEQEATRKNNRTAKWAQTFSDKSLCFRICHYPVGNHVLTCQFVPPKLSVLCKIAELFCSATQAIHILCFLSGPLICLMADKCQHSHIMLLSA